MSGRQRSKRARLRPEVRDIDDLLQLLDELERIDRGRAILAERREARRGRSTAPSSAPPAP